MGGPDGKKENSQFLSLLLARRMYWVIRGRKGMEEEGLGSLWIQEKGCKKKQGDKSEKGQG